MRALLATLKNDDLISLQNAIDDGLSLDCVIRFRSCTIPDILQRGPTLLHACAYFRSINCFRYLLVNGADIIARDDYSRDVTHFAAAGGSMEIIHLLCEYSIKWDHVDIENNNCIHYAVMFHRIEIVYWLWITQNLDLCALNNRKMSPLHLAVTNEEPTMITFLIQNGCDINLKDDRGMAPLHIAASKPNIALVCLLVELGADPTIRDNNGCLPYHWAISAHHQHVQNFLLESMPLVARM